jgi:hypothetical protein
MTNNNNVDDTVDASTTPANPPIDRVPHIPLLNANNTRELFRTAFTTNPTGLIDEVFLICNAAYGMQASIESLRASQTDIADLQTRLENTLITKSDGDATITRLIAENETLLKIIQSGEASRRTPEHPNPDAFTGEDPTLLPNFLQQLELKLEMNKDWWNSEPQRMGYVVSCLKGKAHDQVSYNIKDGVVLFENVNAIKEILKSAFGDIDARATAQLKIFDMKQGHRSLAVFLPEWHAVAKLTEWDSGALIAHLRRALHSDIIWRLSLTKGKDVPTELNQFIDLVRTCDNECRQVNANYFKKHANSSSDNPAATSRPPTIPQLTTSNGGDAMDLSALTWSAADVASGRRPHTDTERAARKAYCTAHGLCHWCSSDKHRSLHCDTAPWREGKA